MPQYMLIMRRDPSFMSGLSAEDMQKALEKYMAWTKRPYTIDSKRLAMEPGKVIRGKQVTDGPFSESKEIFGGFFIIEAADYNQAVSRALEHPHLEYGGSIEVRQLFG